MATLEISTVINRPVDQVFAFLADPAKQTMWQSNLLENEQLTEGPMRVGTHVREVRRLVRRPTVYQAEVTAFEPNQRFALRVITGPQVTLSYAFDPEEGGTRLRYQLVMRPSGMLRVLEPLIAHSLTKQSSSDIAKLKHILER